MEIGSVDKPFVEYTVKERAEKWGGIIEGCIVKGG